MRTVMKKAMTWALICGACAFTATSSWGVTVNLRAEQVIKTVPLPGGGTTNILMWGFALDSAAPTVPGPALIIAPGETQLVINLVNNLGTNVSIVIPGQDGYVLDAAHATFVDTQGRTRARSFVKETLPGQTGVYIWNDLRPGAYLYHSGSHPALQVQMGLYGMLKQDAAVGEVYAGVPYATETDLIFGEIDFDVHDAVQAGTYGTTVKSMIHSVPEVYLLNGEPYKVGELALIGPTNLVRLANACYDERAIVLNGSYGTVIAEDGRKYPYPKVENTINLPALKTRDTLLGPSAAAVKFFDRRILAVYP